MMTTIERANQAHVELLASIGKVSFIESHGRSASVEDINKYVLAEYTPAAFASEISDGRNIYHMICVDEKPVGYSKIILNAETPGIPAKKITKLDRLYLLEEYHDLKLGLKLLQFNIELSQQYHQAGMWLFTWKENHRAVNFYKKNGFEIVGSYDFKLTDTHSNPNHQMLLLY